MGVTRIILVFGLCCITCESSCSKIQPHSTVPVTGNRTDIPEVEIADRTGLNLQKAYAHGNNGGSESSVEENSGAWASGIQNTDGSYNSLSSDARTWGNAYSNGDSPPTTWANTNANVDKGNSWGSSDAGVSGGEGSSGAQTFAVSADSPLGNGQVLYANFKHKVNGTSKVAKIMRPVNATDLSANSTKPAATTKSTYKLGSSKP